MKNPTPITTESGQKFTVTNQLFEGDIADLYACDYEVDDVVAKGAPKKAPTIWDRLRDDEDIDPGLGIFKMARSTWDNDFIEHEAEILRYLWPEGQTEEKFFRYLPHCLCSGQHDSQAYNVFPRFDGYVSMADILRAYPDGIDFRDMVWMFKRTLAGIGFVHRQDVVHGAMIPPHILVHPTDHGAKIVDWCYAVQYAKHPVKAMVPEWGAYYAEAIPNKRGVTPGTDIEMIIRCAIGLIGGNPVTGDFPKTVLQSRSRGRKSLPLEVAEFLKELLLDLPEDAWKVHERFDKLLEKVVGKRKYRPFVMPGGTEDA